MCPGGSRKGIGMQFLLGVAVGAVGMWAYSNGKLQGVMGQPPTEPHGAE